MKKILAAMAICVATAASAKAPAETVVYTPPATDTNNIVRAVIAESLPAFRTPAWANSCASYVYRKAWGRTVEARNWEQVVGPRPGRKPPARHKSLPKDFDLDKAIEEWRRIIEASDHPFRHESPPKDFDLDKIYAEWWMAERAKKEAVIIRLK